MTKRQQADDPDQARRFTEEARKLGVDVTDPAAMDRAFNRLDVHRKIEAPQPRKRQPKAPPAQP